MIVNFYVVFFIPLFYIEALNIHEKNSLKKKKKIHEKK